MNIRFRWLPRVTLAARAAMWRTFGVARRKPDDGEGETGPGAPILGPISPPATPRPHNAGRSATHQRLFPLWRFRHRATGITDGGLRRHVAARRGRTVRTLGRRFRSHRWSPHRNRAAALHRHLKPAHDSGMLQTMSCGELWITRALCVYVVLAWSFEA